MGCANIGDVGGSAVQDHGFIQSANFPRLVLNACTPYLFFRFSLLGLNALATARAISMQ